MEFGTTPALCDDKTCGLEHGQMLRDRLTSKGDTVDRNQRRAQVKERAAVVRGELVEQQTPRRVIEGTEYVGHMMMICKLMLAYQERWNPKTGASRYERP